MATTYTSYQQTVVTEPTQPGDSLFLPNSEFMQQLRREIWVDPIDEPQLLQDLTSSMSFFKGNEVLRTGELNRFLPYGQTLTVPVIKDQNPLSLYQKRAMEYEDIDACQDELKLDCSMPCINTLPEIEKIEVRFDSEYAYGVRACDKDRQFWDYGFFTKQYALSRQGMEFGRELDLWNTVITGLTTSPATTVDVLIAEQHPTHFWADLGDVATHRGEILEGVQYMENAYNVSPTVFMPKEAATAIIESVEVPYNINRSDVLLKTFERWDIPGYEISKSVATILGAGDTPIVIMKRSPWMNGATYNRYPLWNEDRTKQYVAILDPRVAYDLEIDGYHLNILPYDCDKLVRGMVDSKYVAQGITFPQYGMVLEFNGPKHPATPVTGLSFGVATAEIAAGDTETFELTVTPEGATAPIQYVSNNPEVATVAAGQNGAAVTAVAAGVASISAISSGVVATITVTVTEG